MIEPIVSVYLIDERSTQISDVYIKSFKLYASIFSSFPGAEIVLDDPEGSYLANLAIKPGNQIAIIAAPNSKGIASDNSILSLTPLRILGIHNPGTLVSSNEKAMLGSLGGDFKIELTHPWAMQSDWSNHAYRGRSSEIVQQVITSGDKNRGFTFTNITIKESDDKGKVIRYKIGESEARFIHQKILPYSTIDNQAAYSFVDELGAFHFRSFIEMYSQTPKVIVLPPLTDAVPMKLYDTKSPTIQMGIYEGAWWIGRKFLEQLGNFKKTVYIEDPNPNVGLSYAVNIPYRSSIPGYTLMKKDFISNMKTSTDVAILPFRDFEDALRLNVNNTSVMNEYFELSVSIDLAIDLATVGTPIEIKLAGADPSKGHWMNGKWLVIASEHSQYENQMRYYSKYLLARPALNKLPSGINSTSLYSTESI